MPSASAVWYKLSNEGLLVLSEGDITQWSGDAIVNAGTWPTSMSIGQDMLLPAHAACLPCHGMP